MRHETQNQVKTEALVPFSQKGEEGLARQSEQANLSKWQSGREWSNWRTDKRSQRQETVKRCSRSKLGIEWANTSSSWPIYQLVSWTEHFVLFLFFLVRGTSPFDVIPHQLVIEQHLNWLFHLVPSSASSHGLHRQETWKPWACYQVKVPICTAPNKLLVIKTLAMQNESRPACSMNYRHQDEGIIWFEMILLNPGSVFITVLVLLKKPGPDSANI